jgi:hypothetical protein
VLGRVMFLFIAIFLLMTTLKHNSIGSSMRNFYWIYKR